jgi:hypothetical protein
MQQKIDKKMFFEKTEVYITKRKFLVDQIQNIYSRKNDISMLKNIP